MPWTREQIPGRVGATGLTPVSPWRRQGRVLGEEAEKAGTGGGGRGTSRGQRQIPLSH